MGSLVTELQKCTTPKSTCTSDGFWAAGLMSASGTVKRLGTSALSQKFCRGSRCLNEHPKPFVCTADADLVLGWHDGYAVRQRKRKRVEEVFGWMKAVALQRKSRFRGLARVGRMFTFAAAAYNLVRMRNLQIADA